MATPEYPLDRPSLVGSRLKIERALQHLDELEPEIVAYVKRDPYRVAKDTRIEGEWNVVEIEAVREYPNPRWGVRVGEFFHDLRSALDNLVWQLVKVNGEEPGNHNQFPIYTDPPGPARLKALRGIPGATRIDDMLFGVAPEYATVIKELQPYLGTHMHAQHRTALGALAELSNIDKHRFVHPALGMRQKGDAGEVTEVAGPPPKDIEIVYTTGPIYPGAELMRWRIIGGTDETKVTMQGNVPYDIAFGHPHTTLSHLDWIRERIAQVVERFAGAFPSDPSGPEPVSDGHA